MQEVFDEAKMKAAQEAQWLDIKNRRDLFEMYDSHPVSNQVR
jgi:hypothetical protein